MSEHPIGAARVAMTRAVLFANGVETAYCRAGTGPTVVVLGVSLAENTPCRTDLGPLIARCRVFVPEDAGALVSQPTRERDHGVRVQWLHDFLEGLGLAQVSIAARASDAPVLERLVQSFPDDVQRVLFVPDNPTASDWCEVAHHAAGEPLSSRDAAG